MPSSVGATGDALAQRTRLVECSGKEPMPEAFFELHRGLPHQAPSSEATTRWPLALAGRQQGGLARISWYHHVALLDKLDNAELRAWYGTRAAENGWSRDVLVYQIEGQLHERRGRALTNFQRTLPPPDSDLAQSFEAHARGHP